MMNQLNYFKLHLLTVRTPTTIPTHVVISIAVVSAITTLLLPWILIIWVIAVLSHIGVKARVVKVPTIRVRVVCQEVNKEV